MRTHEADISTVPSHKFSPCLQARSATSGTLLHQGVFDAIFPFPRLEGLILDTYGTRNDNTFDIDASSAAVDSPGTPSPSFLCSASRCCEEDLKWVNALGDRCSDAFEYV